MVVDPFHLLEMEACPSHLLGMVDDPFHLLEMVACLCHLLEMVICLFLVVCQEVLFSLLSMENL